MSWIPPVRARLAERFIFNFRMHPEAMGRFVPVPWLAPQVVNGYAVASFCMLDLRGITVAPLPPAAGLRSLSCAPRYAVLDRSGGVPQPAVFVTARWTSSAFGSWFTSLGFSCRHPHARTRLAHGADAVEIAAETREHGMLVNARVRTGGEPRSEVFESAEAFAGFVAAGVSSYGLSRHGRRLTKVDLHKTDNSYTPLAVEHIDGPVIREWLAAGAVLDSAFHTTGGIYEWKYHGLTDEQPAPLMPALGPDSLAPVG